MKGQAERYAADVERLMLRRAEFVEVQCPACGSGSATEKLEKYGLGYLSCERCATMYVSPRPPPDVLDDYYATSENYRYWAKYIFPASEEARREKIFRPRVQRILQICDRHDVRKNLLVEVGAGFGTFAEEMKEAGAFGSVIAIEPTPDLAEACRQRGIRVIEKPVERVDSAELGRPDLIASFEVIEHLFSPADFIRQCHSLLAPGGALVLSCPSGAGFDVTVLRERSDTVDAEHLNYFNPASLTHLLEAEGFEVLEVLTPGELDAELVRNRALAGKVELGPFLRQVLLDRWEDVGGEFQHFLAENLLSSHMWAVARKTAQSTSLR